MYQRSRSGLGLGLKSLRMLVALRVDSLAQCLPRLLDEVEPDLGRLLAQTHYNNIGRVLNYRYNSDIYFRPSSALCIDAHVHTHTGTYYACAYLRSHTHIYTHV